jgi:hypothetical protein
MNIFSKNKTEKTGYTTKFNLYEKVFTIHDNNVISFKITRINIDENGVVYTGDFNEKYIYKKEEKIFRIKQELIKSL